jgi:hypothetical protein
MTSDYSIGMMLCSPLVSRRHVSFVVGWLAMT